MREFLRVALGIQPDFSDPYPRPILAFLARYAGALQSEGDVIQHRAVVERSVVLKNHAAVRARAFHRFAHHLHCTRGGRKLRPQAGDQP